MRKAEERELVLLRRVLLEKAAATLTGHKPASLFSLRREQFPRFAETFCTLRREVEDTVALRCFRKRTQSYLVFVYRPAALCALLRAQELRDFLTALDYPAALMEACAEHHRCARACGHCRREASPLQLECLLAEVAKRMRRDDFPHEVGLFLGYPLRDVEGFIRCRGREASSCAGWKVYGDAAAVEEAEARAALYRETSRRLLRFYEEGSDLRTVLQRAVPSTLYREQPSGGGENIPMNDSSRRNQAWQKLQ